MTTIRSIKTCLIAGAGIGGLATACALAQRGVRVCVLEQAAQLGEIGAGLQLSPNAMAALAHLGLTEQVTAQGFAPNNAIIRAGRTGSHHMTLELRSACMARFGNPYIHIHRADLHQILLEKAHALGVQIALHTPIAGYRPHPDGSNLHLKNGETRTADLIIGADGVRSAITAQMHPAIPPQFTGQVAWRGLLPANAVPTGTISPDATVWIGQGAHIVTYYVRGGDQINFVAVQERMDWQDASWRRQGDVNDLRAAFADWHPALQTILKATQTAHLWALFARPELPSWSQNTVALLGDACHPTLPFMAQGAAMALEDAVVLANCLETRQSPETALAQYESLRKPRTSMLQAKARANARLFHDNSLITKAKLTVAGLLPPRLGYLPLNAVYGYDPRTKGGF